MVDIVWDTWDVADDACWLLNNVRFDCAQL